MHAETFPGDNGSMEPITFADPLDVETALLNSLLVPPPSTLEPGSTSRLRDAMARFSGGRSQAARRAAVDRAVATISTYAFRANARHQAATIITTIGATRDIDAAADIGSTVPVDTVATALGVSDEDVTTFRNHLCAIVEVIGRGGASNPASDDATTWLTGRLDAMGHDGVAAASLLYQTQDSTAALFAATLLADQTGTRRRSALAATTRTAAEDVTIGITQVKTGTRVVIELESASFEFGAGTHRCPGRHVAESIVAGMMDAIDFAGLELHIDAVERHGDGRPRTLPLRLRNDQP